MVRDRKWFLVVVFIPRAAVDFDAHAHGTLVVAVGKESQLARDDNRVEQALLGHVRVRVSLDHLHADERREQINFKRMRLSSRWHIHDNNI